MIDKPTSLVSAENDRDLGRNLWTVGAKFVLWMGADPPPDPEAGPGTGPTPLNICSM